MSRHRGCAFAGGSPLQIEHVWEYLGGQDVPLPLQVASYGEDAGERLVLRRRVAEELRAAGLLRGEWLDGELEQALRLLQHPQRWTQSVWMPDEHTDSPAQVLAASSGSQAVLGPQPLSEEPPDGVLVDAGVRVGEEDRACRALANSSADPTRPPARSRPTPGPASDASGAPASCAGSTTPATAATYSPSARVATASSGSPFCRDSSGPRRPAATAARGGDHASPLM